MKRNRAMLCAIFVRLRDVRFTKREILLQRFHVLVSLAFYVCETSKDDVADGGEGGG